MTGRIITTATLDVQDGTTFIQFDVGPWQRIAVQMNDPNGEIGSAVVELTVGIDGQMFNSYGTAVEFTSTASTHYQRDIAVEHVTQARLQATTTKATAGTVWFTVYGYNVEG